MESLYYKLDQIQRRLRWVHLIQQIVFFLLISLALCCGLVMLSKGIVVPLPVGLMCWGIIAAGMAGGIFSGMMKPVTRSHAARVADARTHSQERLSSALEFAADPISPFTKPLLDDARTIANQLDPQSVVPYVLPRQSRWVFSLGVLLIGLIVLPDFPGHSAPTDPDTVALIHKEAKELEKYAGQLQDKAIEKELDEVQKMAEKMEQIAKQLQKQQIDKKEALRKLSQMEQQITEQQKQELAQWDTKKLRQAVKQLEAAQNNSTNELAENQTADVNRHRLASQKAQELAKAKRQLEKLSQALQNESFTKSEQKDVAKALDHMSQNLDQMDMETAGDHLADAAAELDQGDQQEAADAIEDAIAALEQEMKSAEQQLAQHQAMQEALDQVRDSKQTIAGASQQMQQAEKYAQTFDDNPSISSGQIGQDGEPSGTSNPSEQNPQSGTSPEEAVSGGTPQPQNASGQGHAQSGTGDWGTESTNLAQESGKEVKNEPSQQHRQGEAPRSQVEAYHRLYDPRRTEVTTKGTRVTGKLGEGEFAGQAETTALPSGEIANRPAYEMYLDYRQAAEAALNQAEIPRGYQGYVKDYFEAIKPE